METRQLSTGNSTRQSTSIWNSYKLRRAGIIAAYTVFFWIALPFGIIAASLKLDDAFFLQFLSNQIFIIIGAVLLFFSAILLSISIIQFIEGSGELPISAFQPERLVKTGLYAIWRHPIYLFYTLSLLGIALVLRSEAMAVIMLPSFALGVAAYVSVEEEALETRLGDEYISYCRRTPLIFPQLTNILRLPLLILFKILFRFSIHGKEKFPAATPFFIVSTHRNYLDPFFIGLSTAFPVRFVTTFEVFRNILSGILFGKLLSIPRRRYMPDTRTARAISAALRDGYVVGLFPEGERSWTGEVGPLKPEVMRLLKHYHDVPVVPVRIEGNYAVWPRWRKGIRRGRISLTVLDPVSFDDSSTCLEMEKTLKSIIGTSMPDRLSKRTADARGLDKIVYRCPGCGSFDSLRYSHGNTMACGVCKTELTINEDLSVTVRRPDGVRSSGISELYGRVRVSAADFSEPYNVKRALFADLLSSDESPIALSESCAYSVGDGTRLAATGHAKILLTDANLIVLVHSGASKIPLTEIYSVTIESNNKLQIYQPATDVLTQFKFTQESALKWQDFIAGVIKLRYNRDINLN